MKSTMTEDQFKQLLGQNNTQLLKQFDKRLDERLEQNNAVLFGQISKYFDARFDALHTKLKEDTGRIYTTVDGIAKRLMLIVIFFKLYVPGLPISQVLLKLIGEFFITIRITHYSPSGRLSSAHKTQ
jgi:hypothetical protein